MLGYERRLEQSLVPRMIYLKDELDRLGLTWKHTFSLSQFYSHEPYIQNSNTHEIAYYLLQILWCTMMLELYIELQN